jgi:hypothetical protein|tara:strand:+ start:692 stop:1525 length:834 start_codon:yes stop_codon:yes gene_type:complete
MTYLYPAKSYTQFEISGKTITVIGENHLQDDFSYEVLKPDTWLVPHFLLHFIQNEYDTHKSLYLEMRGLSFTSVLEKQKAFSELKKTFTLESKNMKEFIANVNPYYAPRIFGGDKRRHIKVDGYPNWQNTLYGKNVYKANNNFFLALCERIQRLIREVLKYCSIPEDMPPNLIHNLKMYYENDIKNVENFFKSSDNSYNRINNILILQRAFGEISDYLMMRDILLRPETDIMILFGEEHAIDFKITMKNYIKKYKKEKRKFFGKELTPNYPLTVSMR